MIFFVVEKACGPTLVPELCIFLHYDLKSISKILG